MVMRGLSKNASAKDRLLARVGAPDSNGCWPWLGGTRPNGYGTFAVKRDGNWSQTTAHRIAYQSFIGPIPEGFEVDHVCRNRACCNPEHLEAVPLQVNRKRRNDAKTHCAQGHAFTPENTYWYRGKDGYLCRQCNICRRFYSRQPRKR